MGRRLQLPPLLRFGIGIVLGAAPSGDESDDTGGDGHRGDIIEARREGLEDVKGGEHQDGEEESVVVEDGKRCGLVLCDLVLLPQDTFVLFLAADLLVIVQLPRHLLSHSRLSLHRDLVLEEVLCVTVCECYKPRGDEGDDSEEWSGGHRLHRVDTPKQPKGDGAHYERVAVEQRR